MTYDPRTYWTSRALREGPAYVATHGSPVRSEEQLVAFGEVICTAVGESQFGWVLDFGCGSGRFGPLLSGFGRRYFGMDLSPSGVAQARLAHPDLEFWWMEEDRIPLDDNKVSVAFAITVFQHITDDFDLWASELRRVLKPDARMFVIDAPYTESKKFASHMCVRRPEEMAEALGRTVLELPSVLSHWAGWFMPGNPG